MPGEWIRILRPAERRTILLASSAATVSRAAEDLGEDALGWTAETARALAEVTLDRFPDLALARSPEGMQRVGESCILAVLNALLHDSPAEIFSAPDDLLSETRELACQNTPLETLLRATWICHEYVLRRIRDSIQLRQPQKLSDDLFHLTDLSFGYVHELCAAASQAYGDALEGPAATIAAEQRRMVDRILSGSPVAADEAQKVLGISMDGTHVAAVVWDEVADGLGSLTPGTPMSDGVAFLWPPAPASLSVAAGQARSWIWMNWAQEPPSDLSVRLRQAFDSQTRHVALGPPAAGIEGFRDSHWSARETERVSRIVGATGIHAYDEFAVTALATADPEQAIRFARHALGALGGDTTRLSELRETLRLYLAHGRSRAAAASVLHVSANTIAYRVKKAEELLGRPVPGDSIDLRLALEIARLDFRQTRASKPFHPDLGGARHMA